MVKVVAMVKSAVPPNAFASFQEVEDRWIRTTILEGDVLVEKKLGPKGTPPGLVANIPPGMRAFAIDVTEQSGVSGFILPRHRVDVLRHEASEKKTAPRWSSRTCSCWPIGQVFTRQEERTIQCRTVTLALKPSEVDILVVARARGTLSLSLRGVNDHDVVAPTCQAGTRPRARAAAEIEEEKRLKIEGELRDLRNAVRQAQRAGYQTGIEPRHCDDLPRQQSRRARSYGRGR